jgi:hypothetical protein
MFTPQVGAEAPEILTPAERTRAVNELQSMRQRFPKAQLPPAALARFLSPPETPDDCIFARTTRTISADLKTVITPCQFGGEPDCSQCGCFASMALGAVGDHKLGGLIPVGAIFRASFAVGRMFSSSHAPVPVPDLIQLRTTSASLDRVSD